MTRKFPILAVFAALLMFLTGASALAAQNEHTWQPDFVAGKTVYVDEALQSGRNAVDFSGLEAKLKALGKKHDLTIYFVAVEQGRDLPVSGSKAMSGRYLDLLQVAWGSAQGFDAKNHLIITWVRQYDNPLKGSFGGVGGAKLLSMNMDPDYFSARNGPIGRDILTYMRPRPQDPEGLVVAIANNVNSDISAIEFEAMLPYYITGGVIGVLLLILVIWLTLRYRGRRREAEKHLAEFGAKVDSSTELGVKLKDGYWGFLSEQSDWKSRFVDDTLIAFEAALKDYGKFVALQEAAIVRRREIQEALKSARWPGVSKLDEGIALATTVPVPVTGDDIPLDQAKLFEGLVEHEEYLPPELLEGMDDRFTRTNKALAEIVNAFKGARQNRKDIEELLGTITETKPALEAAELVFDPYEDRLAAIKAGKDAFLAILQGNPLRAFANSEVVEADTETLKADLLRAIEIKTSLPGIMADIEKVEDRAASQRGKTATYSYQISGDEAAPESAGEKFKLTAKNGNPDPILATSRRHHKSCDELVYAGKLDEADKARQDAIERHTAANKLITDTLTAKTHLEKKVTPAHTTFAALSDEIPAGNEAVTELKSDFLPKNIKGYPGKLTTAEAVRDKHAATMAKVKELYDAQDFLKARAVLDGQQSEIDSSRQAIRDTHTWLATLRKQRTDSRATVERCVSDLSALTAKIKRHDFTTSRNTDDRFDTVDAEVKRLQTETAKRVADWPALDQEALTAERELKAIDETIDVEKAAYDAASTAVSNAQTAISNARTHVRKDYVRDPAENDYAEAKELYGSASTMLGTAKADWEEVKSLADSAKTHADSAKKKAKNDVAKASAARNAISTAETTINSYRFKTYGHGVSINLSSARRKLSSANTNMSNGNYEQAKSDADSAASKAAEAHRSAKRSAKRKADAAAAALSSTNNGPGIGGGGGGGGNIGGGGGGGNVGGNAGGVDY